MRGGGVPRDVVERVSDGRGGAFRGRDRSGLPSGSVVVPPHKGHPLALESLVAGPCLIDFAVNRLDPGDDPSRAPKGGAGRDVSARGGCAGVRPLRCWGPRVRGLANPLSPVAIARRLPGPSSSLRRPRGAKEKLGIGSADVVRDLPIGPVAWDRRDSFPIFLVGRTVVILAVVATAPTTSIPTAAEPNMQFGVCPRARTGGPLGIRL